MFSSFSHHYSSHSSTVSSVMKERICDSHKCTKRKKNMHQVNNELADLCFLLWNRVFLTASGAYLWQYIPLSGLWMFPQYWYYKARYSHTLSYFFNIYLYLIKRGMKSTLRCLQFALFATKGNKTLVTVIDRLDFKAFLNPLQQEFSRFSCAKGHKMHIFN